MWGRRCSPARGPRGTSRPRSRPGSSKASKSRSARAEQRAWLTCCSQLPFFEQGSVAGQGCCADLSTVQGRKDLIEKVGAVHMDVSFGPARHDALTQRTGVTEQVTTLWNGKLDILGQPVNLPRQLFPPSCPPPLCCQQSAYTLRSQQRWDQHQKSNPGLLR